MNNRKKEINREYKERRVPAGIFHIKNTVNGKVLLCSSVNLEGRLNRHKFQLSSGLHPNKDLQNDWNALGSEKFEFEILEVVKVSDDPIFNLEDELTLLEQIWVEKLNPVGETGYNLTAAIRQA